MMKLTKIRYTLRTTFCHLPRFFSRFQARTELLMIPRALIISVRVPIFKGIKAPNEIKKAFNNAVNELAAIAWRSMGALAWTICSGAIDIATKSSPTSAAAAPELARKKLVNCGGTMVLCSSQGATQYQGRAIPIVRASLQVRTRPFYLQPCGYPGLPPLL